MFADLKMIRTFAPLSTESTSDKEVFGEVAEWSIAAVLKTVVLRGTRGSNPCLSAELTGQNRIMNSKVLQTQCLWDFFIPLMCTEIGCFGSYRLHSKLGNPFFMYNSSLIYTGKQSYVLVRENLQTGKISVSLPAWQRKASYI